MKYLQASGKIKRTPAHKSNITRGQGVRKQVNGADQGSDDDAGSKSNRSSDRSQSNPPTDRTLTKRVDDIFQVPYAFPLRDLDNGAPIVKPV